MHKNEFIEGLSQTFKGGNEIVYEDLGDWLTRCQLTPTQLGDLYVEIKENYKYQTFPALAVIKKYWENIYREPAAENISPIMRQRRFVESWDVKKIIKTLIEFRQKKILGSHEIDFMHQWSDLWSEYQILIDQEEIGDTMRLHLEYVKDCIIRGEKFETAFKKHVEIEDDVRAGTVQSIGDLI